MLPRKSPALDIGYSNDGIGKERLAQSVRSQHMHVLGATGTGKSRFLQSMIRQDILNGDGLCLIDPHGTLCRQMMEWLSNRETLIGKRNIHVLRPYDRRYSFGFNPLAVSDERSLGTVVDATVSGLAELQGSVSLFDNPLLQETMWAVGMALASAKMTIAEAGYFVFHHYGRERDILLKRLKNPYFIDLWESYRSKNARDWADYFQPAARRFGLINASPVLRRIFGQNEKTLDLRDVMDRGDIVLLDLSKEGATFTPTEATIIGRLMVNNLLARAYERPAERSRPFYLYIDEAHLFMSSNIPQILAEMRKYGLHLILAHQNLGQLRHAGEFIHDGVMANARTKVFFGLDDPADADALVDRVFAGHFNYEEPKRSLDKPIVIGHQRTRLESRSQSLAHTRTQTETSGITNVRSTAIGESDVSSKGGSEGTGTASGLVLGGDGTSSNDAMRAIQTDSSFSGTNWADAASSSFARGFASGKHTSDAYSSGKSDGETSGYSEAFEPLMRVAPTATFSLQEQQHRFKQVLMMLEGRYGFLVTPGKKSKPFRTLDVPDEYISKKRMERIGQSLVDNSPCHKPAEDAEREIKSRLIETGLPDIKPDDWLE